MCEHVRVYNHMYVGVHVLTCVTLYLCSCTCWGVYVCVCVRTQVGFCVCPDMGTAVHTPGHVFSTPGAYTHAVCAYIRLSVCLWECACESLIVRVREGESARINVSVR